MQRELERASIEARTAAVVLCDRGTIDGIAYWAVEEEQFWADTRSTAEDELAHYAAVIHLRTPSVETGYDRTNPLRIESALEAAAIDARIADAWSRHPHCAVVDSDVDFLKKMARAVGFVREEVPACCKGHRIPEID